MRFVACLLFALAFVAGSLSAEQVQAPAEERKARGKKVVRELAGKGERKLDVCYKKVGERELGVDVYYPEGRALKGLPVVVYTHGGGWAAGSKKGIGKGNMSRAALGFLEEGFCVVAVEYRLYRKEGEVAMRDCVIDCKDAVRYLAKHSEELGLDAERFFVFGDSAGGQIAQMLLLTSPESLAGDEGLGGTGYKIVAGVSWYGPCDFEKMDLFNHDDREGFRDRFGPRILKPDSDPKDKLRLYREMSPIQYLKKDSPPLLMIQGDQDTTIPVKHAHHMKKRAEEIGAPVEIMIIKNSGHNWRKVGAEIEPGTDVIVERTVGFLADRLEGGE